MPTGESARGSNFSARRLISPTVAPADGQAPTDPLPLADLERINIQAALRRSGGNKNEAARILGIDRQRLYRKIEKYGLQ